ncbi:uncharacterized protein PSFLO_01413 [Pseudozyma flocculosa]|uniref:Uncharacterized protein n=1 Tax=Pseudozyma flocculosa TaxID=84751 RepID=A0A5C3EV75_9BASI|nr:uncharacterized protein PSFLO_01413 [Pseudozyma flocculosa]
MPSTSPISTFSPPSSPDEAGVSRAPHNPNYGIAKFQLQPAPRDRRSARARSPRLRRRGSQDSQTTINGGDSGNSSAEDVDLAVDEARHGRFQEHLSWDARPSSCDLDTPPRLDARLPADVVGIATAPSPGPDREAMQQQTNLRRQPSVPRSVYEEVQSPSSASMDVDEFPLPLASAMLEATSQGQDPNVRLSAQAGTVAHSRRAHIPLHGAACQVVVGRRGQERLKRQRESTILTLPPMSPLTPRRAETLHTPTRVRADAVRAQQVNGHLAVETPAPASRAAAEAGDDIERTPLSATLKEIGAKRATFFYTPPEAVEADYNVPAWASRFQANHHRRHVLEDNKKAIEAFRPLQLVDSSATSVAPALIATDATTDTDVETTVKREDFGAEVAGLSLPQLTVAGDIMPFSPNGDLLSGDPSALLPRSRLGQQEQAASAVAIRTLATPRDRQHGAPAKVQSTGRGLFLRPDGGHGSNRVSHLVDAIKTLKPSPRKGWNLSIPYRRHTTEAEARSASNTGAIEERRDGWGGILTRCSWFSSDVKGPLISPCPPLVPSPSNGDGSKVGFDGEADGVAKPSGSARKLERRARFKSLDRLVEAIPRPASDDSSERIEELAEADEWEDLPLSPSPSLCSSSDETLLDASSSSQKSSLEKGAPRFVKTVDPASFSKPLPDHSAPTKEGGQRRTGWQRLFELGRSSCSSLLASPAATASTRKKEGQFVYDDEVFVIGRRRAPSVSSSRTSSSSFGDKADRSGDKGERSIVQVGEGSVESRPLPGVEEVRRTRKRRAMVHLLVLFLLVASVGLNIALFIERSDVHIHPVASAAASTSSVRAQVPVDGQHSAALNGGAGSTIAPTYTSPLPNQASTVAAVPTAASNPTTTTATATGPDTSSDSAATDDADDATISDSDSPEEIQSKLEQQGRITAIRHAAALSGQPQSQPQRRSILQHRQHLSSRFSGFF